VDGVELVIKRYNTKNPWHRIRRNFQKTRASNCRHMAAEFIELGIAVPDSVAVIEERFGPLSGRSWYVSEYVDSEMLLDYLAVDDWQARYAQLVDRIIEIFGILRRNRLSHGDMKATNWLVRQGELLLIDLDATRRHRSAQSHRRALLKDRARFLKNWDNQPSLRAQFAQRLDEAGI
jgi:tRNA A-37 threonylcarbamoyl transferase component Bud32